MKTLLLATFISLVSTSSYAQFTDAQRQCWDVTNQIAQKYVLATSEFIADKDLREFDALTLPIIKAIEAVSSVCEDPSISEKQVDLLKKTFL